ncbi:MAG TPA: hypothetical protein ENN45_03795, partial [Bacteroidetes bacterium]|nr:hypothetical protein [Bacteroidota bacterium]
MKVIYATAYSDPWIKVAQKLKEEKNFEPVYWIGYEDDKSEKIISELFPNCLYHNYFDAWKGVIPESASNLFSPTNLNIDFIKNFASVELQAIKMMDRMDSDRKSFNFMERQRHYRKILKYWTACLEFYKPDLIISPTIPHQLFDFTIFHLCNFLKIKFLTYVNTPFVGHIIPNTNITFVEKTFSDEYSKIYNSSKKTEEIKNELPSEILNIYEKVQTDYTKAKPEYMIQHVSKNKKGSNPIALLKKFLLKDIKTNNLRIFGKNGVLFSGFPSYIKQKNKNIEKVNMPILAYTKIKFKNIAYKNRLKKYYASLAKAPSYDVPYVIFPMHYQPEMTSSPSGDIFVDQSLCIDALLKHLPKDYFVYVKEHPAQFYKHTEGHTSRIKEFYTDLASNPRIKLIPIDIDTFTLIEKAQAVVTVTGTVGWEAMVRKKPVIIFGITWYEQFEGVLKITDEDSASKIYQFIQNYEFSERKLISYLYTLSKISVKAYHYRGKKEKVKIDEDLCIENLINSID